MTCVFFLKVNGTRWAPTSYKWSYKPYKWPYKWVTGVITLLIGVITPLITGSGAHLVVGLSFLLFFFGLGEGTLLSDRGIKSSNPNHHKRERSQELLPGFEVSISILSMVVEMVPLKGGIGSIFHPPEGNIYHLYIAFWGVICHLPPFRGTRNNH